MLSRISQLKEDEQAHVKKAPVLVGLLIAAADHHIETEEIERIARTVHTKTFSEKNDVSNLYEEISHEVEKMISDMVGTLPTDAGERVAFLNAEIAKLNPIIKKLDPVFARQLYKSLRSMAVSVANASGGILGMGSVSHSEKELLSLEMLEDPGKLEN